MGRRNPAVASYNSFARSHEQESWARLGTSGLYTEARCGHLLWGRGGAPAAMGRWRGAPTPSHFHCSGMKFSLHSDPPPCVAQSRPWEYERMGGGAERGGQAEEEGCDPHGLRRPP